MLSKKFHILVITSLMILVLTIVHFMFIPLTGLPQIIIGSYNGQTAYGSNLSTASTPVSAWKPTGTVPPGLKFVHQDYIFITPDLSPAEAENRYYTYVTRKHVECATQRRLGNFGDGGWNMCLEGPYKPGNPCYVYSFGINNDWSFDDAISRDYGCEVRAFDPSMGIGDHKHSNLVYFYQTGLGGSDQTDNRGWKLRTLKTLLEQFQQTSKVIDYLKIDIEYAEWDSFAAIFKEGGLENVKQFGFETHTHEVGGQATTVAEFVQYWKMLDQLEKAGFRRWYWHFNHYGKYTSRRTGKGRTCCYEMVYININFLNGPLPEAAKVTGYKLTSGSPAQVTTAPTKALPAGITLHHLPPIQVTPQMSPREAEVKFYEYVTRNDATCVEHVRLGNPGDGGWDMCVSGPYKPKEPCTVYSFGINNDWSFDDAISRRYKCKVKAFDPSMRIGDHAHSALVYFYRTGIGANDGVSGQGWKIRSLKTLINNIGDTGKTIDMLKIDIEYNEWEALAGMFRDQALKNIKQFAFEIHTHELAGGRPTTVPEFVSYFGTLKKLESLGFRKWHNHFNPYGVYHSRRTGQRRTCCYELYYINTNFLG